MSTRTAAHQARPGMPTVWCRSIAIGVAWCTAMLLISLPVDAQVVTGRVIDDETGDGVAGAELLLLDGDDRAAARAISADDGTFALRPDEHGRYRLNARRIGYATAASSPLDLVGSDSLDVEFRMATEAIPLAPLTVVGRQRRLEVRDPRLERRDYYERRDRYGSYGFGRFLEGEDLRATAFTIGDLVREVPGIRIYPVGGREEVIRGRSGRPCGVLLNGMKAGPTEDILPSALVAIEVYPGMVAPATYGGRGCVIVLWTGVREWRDD